MFGNLKPITIYSLARKVGLAALCAYAGVVTVMLIRLDPKPLLIGLDSYGTRIIRDGGDRLLRQEKEAFLKHFLSLSYSYDQATFEKRISDSGDLMNEALWSQKKAEFVRVGSELKSEELTQTLEIQSLREIDSDHFEADVLLHIKKRLTQSAVHLRVELKLHPTSRRESNPYPFEVERWDESLGDTHAS